jgi:WD40 repeat protein
MRAVAFSPDGQEVAFGGQLNRAYTASWAVGRREPEALALPSSEGVACLVYGPDGRQLFCGTRGRGRSAGGNFYVLRARPLWVRSAHEEPAGAYHIAVRPDGMEVCLGTGQGWRFFDPETRRPTGGGSVGVPTPAVSYSSDGDIIAVATGLGVRLHRGEGKILAGYLSGHSGQMSSLAFTPNGAALLSAAGRTVLVWDVRAQREVEALDWGQGHVHHVCVAPDGMTAAAACDKGLVIWDLDL